MVAATPAPPAPGHLYRQPARVTGHPHARKFRRSSPNRPAIFSPGGACQGLSAQMRNPGRVFDPDATSAPGVRAPPVTDAEPRVERFGHKIRMAKLCYTVDALAALGRHLPGHFFVSRLAGKCRRNDQNHISRVGWGPAAGARRPEPRAAGPPVPCTRRVSACRPGRPPPRHLRHLRGRPPAPPGARAAGQPSPR